MNIFILFFRFLFRVILEKKINEIYDDFKNFTIQKRKERIQTKKKIYKSSIGDD